MSENSIITFGYEVLSTDGVSFWKWLDPPADRWRGVFYDGQVASRALGTIITILLRVIQKSECENLTPKTIILANRRTIATKNKKSRAKFWCIMEYNSCLLRSYLTSMSLSRLYGVGWVHDRWIVDLERSDHRVIKVLTRGISGGIEESHEGPQSGQPVSQPKFEPSISRVQV
jgi:hypothetical protein